MRFVDASYEIIRDHAYQICRWMACIGSLSAGSRDRRRDRCNSNGFDRSGMTVSAGLSRFSLNNGEAGNARGPDGY